MEGWLVSRRSWRKTGVSQSNPEITSCIPQFHPWLKKINLSLSVIELETVYFMNVIVIVLIPFLLLNKIRKLCYQYFAIILHSIWSHILSCLPLRTLPIVHSSVVVTH